MIVLLAAIFSAAVDGIRVYEGTKFEDLKPKPHKSVSKSKLIRHRYLCINIFIIISSSINDSRANINFHRSDEKITQHKQEKLDNGR